MKNYIEILQQEFAKYGFTTCPLTEVQMGTLYSRAVDMDIAYEIGCDVNSGYRFDVAFEVSLVGEG
jgi:hypothetical protein